MTSLALLEDLKACPMDYTHSARAFAASHRKLGKWARRVRGMEEPGCLEVRQLQLYGVHAFSVAMRL